MNSAGHNAANWPMMMSEVIPHNSRHRIWAEDSVFGQGMMSYDIPMRDGVSCKPPLEGGEKGENREIARSSCEVVDNLERKFEVTEDPVTTPCRRAQGPVSTSEAMQSTLADPVLSGRGDR